MKKLDSYEAKRGSLTLMANSEKFVTTLQQQNRNYSTEIIEGHTARLNLR